MELLDWNSVSYAGGWRRETGGQPGTALESNSLGIKNFRFVYF